MAKDQVLTAEEISQVLAIVNEYGWSRRRAEYGALFVLLANLGLRVSEALQLQWRDVDFERGELIVRTLKQKTRRTDALPLNGACAQTLRLLRNGQPEDARIFTLHRATAWRIFQDCLEKAGIAKRKLHSLRHSTATRLLEQTGDLVFVRDILRHASISTTSHYLHCRELRKKYLELPAVS